VRAFAEFAEGWRRSGSCELVSGDGCWKCCAEWVVCKGSQVRDPILRDGGQDGANVGLEQVEKGERRDGGADNPCARSPEAAFPDASRI